MKKTTHPASDATLAIHAGEDRHGRNAPLTTEIQQTAVFALRNTEQLRRYLKGEGDVYLYTRYGNPTLRAAEEKIAALELGEDCVLTASGLAAEFCAALALCRAGDEIACMMDVYGGTAKLFRNLLQRCGIHTRLIPFDGMAQVEDYFSPQTRMLFLETPTNPTLRCVDIAKLARLARKHKITTVVDNTFATPILQKPLTMGADLVVHSATKYLGGHSDLTAGAVAGSKKLIAKVRETMILSGGCSDPGVAYLLLRGLKTLDVRMERACGNAQQIAEFLVAHPRVAQVFYSGLPTSPEHELAARQMKGFGAMVSFDIRGGGRAAERFLDALKLWYLATSLGGVESTVSYPVLSSHASLKAKELKLLGVSPATIRLSAGIEDARDLVADLSQALDAAGK
ncbi:MAG: aminotransferase class I/II-fold pyridoxal phosphate-dependent enzyme [Acidobacteriota bacterium]|nr:aminotransferase class I/II-fold pyridoxal phosphate-dependent enzyme [Acidobacteriota bacterium]